MIVPTSECNGLIYDNSNRKEMELLKETCLIDPVEVEAYRPNVDNIRKMIKELREDPEVPEEETIAWLLRLSQVAVVVLTPET